MVHELRLLRRHFSVVVCGASLLWSAAWAQSQPSAVQQQMNMARELAAESSSSGAQASGGSITTTAPLQTIGSLETNMTTVERPVSRQTASGDNGLARRGRSAAFADQQSDAHTTTRGGENLQRLQRFVPPYFSNWGNNGPQEAAAFDSMTKSLLPLSPAQVHRLKQLFEESKRSEQAPATIPPRPTASSQIVNLAPGSTPPVVRLSQGFVSTIDFLDSTGAPWPIEAYDLGNPQAFNVQWNQKDNTLMIQAMSLYTYGNMAVRLQGLKTPVMLTLIPGQRAVDYRIDMRLNRMGPMATNMPVGDGLPPAADSTLMSVLDGATPNGGKLLQVTGHLAQAWSVADKIYLRTQYTLLSPGWINSLRSADGTTVYELQRTPLVLASVHGKVVKIKLKGF